MTAMEIYDQAIKGLSVSERLQLAKLIIDDISDRFSASSPNADQRPEVSDESGDFGGRSLGEMMTEIGFVDNGPSDMSENPERYMHNFGLTSDQRAA